MVAIITSSDRSRTKGFFLALWLIGFSSVLPVVASAQQNPNTKRFTPSLNPKGFLGVQGTRTPGSYLWNLGLFLSYSYNPLILSSADQETSHLLVHRLNTDMSAEMGIGGRLAIAVTSPFAVTPRGESPLFAVADPLLIARYRFIGVDADEAPDNDDGPGGALQLGTSVPIGSEDGYLGEGSVTTHTSLLWDFHLLDAGIGLSLGWLHRFGPYEFSVSPTDSIRFRDEISYGLAIKLPLPWFERAAGLIECRGATDAGNPFSRWETTPLETELGVRFGLSEVTLLTAIGTSIGSGIGAPDFRGIVGVWWSPRTSDMDSDGIDDDEDECPPLAEDMDGYMDHDGCPDPDNDGDWIPDLDDLCPNEAAEEDRDLNEDGCTDK